VPVVAVVGASLVTAGAADAARSASALHQRVDAPLASQVISPSPESSAWCTTFTGEATSGGVLEGWMGLQPNLPVCGPSPEFSSAKDANTPVRLPEAWGDSFWDGTLDGFQCVELADRWLAMAYGLNVVLGNGDKIASNYYAAYHSSHPEMRLIANGTAGGAPKPGDVISFSHSKSFTDSDGGHVAVVVKGGTVNSAGNGEIYIAQENIGGGLSFTHQELTVSGWKVSGEGFSYLEWLRVSPGWEIQSTPNSSAAESSELNGVSCPSATACMAVGDYVDGSGVDMTLAEQWNGTNWGDRIHA
jgi:hypothetical protein